MFKSGCKNEWRIGMKIGYASKTVGLADVPMRTARLNNVTDDKLIELIENNLRSLDGIIEYNIKNNIRMFRISSDIIPFGSHEINQLEWWKIFSKELSEIGTKAIKHNMRLSMHPGQYTVLNSPDKEIVNRAVEDLMYHARFLDALHLNGSHKIILHIGGVYGDKSAAMQRFVENYQQLDERIKKRLIIENDDRQYTISEVLNISRSTGIPVVFDNLHHESNPDDSMGEMDWLMEARKTWKELDGRQKIHYSQQDEDKRVGAHTPTIDIEIFNDFYQKLPTKELDIMFEVKDKNLSAMKGIHLTGEKKIKYLEQEWSRYKYLILEHSPNNYQAIRQLLKDKTAYPVIAFYELIDQALETPIVTGQAINVAQHIWGYVNDVVSEKEKNQFQKQLIKFSEGASRKTFVRTLWKLIVKYDQTYLKDSLYFKDLF